MKRLLARACGWVGAGVTVVSAVLFFAGPLPWVPWTFFAMIGFTEVAVFGFVLARRCAVPA